MTRLLLGALTLAVAGCAQLRPRQFVDESVSSAPSAGLRPAEATPGPTAGGATPSLPQTRPGEPLALTQLLDVALRTSPLTRATWFDARAAAAQVGVKNSAYYPMLEVDAQLQAQHQTVTTGQRVDAVGLGPAAVLNYLVLDFGGRAADVEEARTQLAFANMTHSAAVQDLVLRVTQAYYQLLAFKALQVASASNQHEAQVALTAASERQKSGVATLADVLQAKTAASQARLTQRTVEGLVATAKGALSAALGLPATTPVEVGELPESVDAQAISKTVDELVVEAQARRPDLAAARTLVPRAEARARSVSSAGLPSLVLSGSASVPFYLYNPVSTSAYGDNYGALLLFRVPLFTGFRDSYLNAQADEAVAAAQARFDATQAQVVLQVWTSYQALTTATQRLGAAKDLLDSAKASNDVATGRYEAGAGTLLDLLTAQAALASARAQEVQARADYLISLAALAHDTGALDLGPKSGSPAGEARP
jgi:outer membrane protein TolC